MRCMENMLCLLGLLAPKPNRLLPAGAFGASETCQLEPPVGHLLPGGYMDQPRPGFSEIQQVDGLP